MSEKVVQVRIRKLEASQLAKAKETLVKAFYDDPNLKYLIRDENRRPILAGYSLEGALRQGLAFGEVYTSEDLDGIAIWLSPGKKPTLIKSIRAGLLSTGLKTLSSLGWAGLKRYAGVTGCVLKLHKRVMPGPHWYLSIIGVNPSAQGKGLGVELMKPILAKAEEQGVPCYLETSNQKSISFYQKQGFEIAEEVVVPGSDLHIWALVRKPGEQLD
jgi:ribosomal protein S18 acetylase RimI-like enzyme